jgi:hypothetical protein
MRSHSTGMSATHSTPAAGRARRPTPPWAKLALIVASLAMVACMLEVATRLFSNVTPPLLCNDTVLGTTFIRNYSGSVYVPECGREVLLRFNRDGMRNPVTSVEKRSGVRRIAVMGDSMIAAIATDEPNTLVRRLADRLNHGQSEPGFEVLNFGVSGSSTGQQLVLYRELVRKYHPDVVVCAFCVANDLGDNCARLTSNRGRIYFDVDPDGRLVQLPFSAGRAALTSWLNRHSRFYVWQKGATQNAINALRTSTLAVAARAGHEAAPLESGGQGIFCTAPGETLVHAWLITEKLIETMHREVQADGADFILAVLPTGWQVCDDAWSSVVSAAQGAPMDAGYPDQRLAEIAGRLAAPVVVMTDRFREAAPHHSLAYKDEWLHYDGAGHFNDRGNDLAAEAIYQVMAETAQDSARRDRPDSNRQYGVADRRP